MKERPILFSGPMVRALLAGTKTQTRRIVKLRGDSSTSGAFWDHRGYEPVEIRHGVWAFRWKQDTALATAAIGSPMWICPYGTAGDRLWVKETFFPISTVKHEPKFAAVGPDYVYRADYEYREPGRSVIAPHHWKPSIFCTRKASRITLEITGVRVERLNDISKDDSKAEGIERIQAGEHQAWKNYRFKTAHPRRGKTVTDQEHRLIGYESPCASYTSLWESINGPGSWDANPYVWVIEFRRITP